MDEIKAVLLIPAEGDPFGLLREGPCGGRPPMARRFWESETSNRLWSLWYPFTGGVPVPKEQRALVLAWNGKPVAEGLDRLGRAEGVTREWVSKVVGFALGWWPDDVDALTDPDLTLVFLDAEGREVRND